MIAIKDINSEIMFGDLSVSELDSIAQAIKYRRAQLARENKRELAVGATVKFTHPKTGRIHIGSVYKIKIKNVTVKEGMVNWNVPAHMLETV